MSSCYDGLYDAYEDGAGSKIYAIGDTGPGGGIVFYITDGGIHGMEVAPAGWYNGSGDPEAVWGNTTTSVSTLIAIGKGASNTDAIITTLGITGAAAELCADYTGGGFNDWFLPSHDELKEIINQFPYEKNYVVENLAGFSSGSYYWSSSEYTTTRAYVMYPNTGNMSDADKSGYNRVRPVRAF